jgi:hypothetical protein
MKAGANLLQLCGRRTGGEVIEYAGYLGGGRIL